MTNTCKANDSHNCLRCTLSFQLISKCSHAIQSDKGQMQYVISPKNLLLIDNCRWSDYEDLNLFNIPDIPFSSNPYLPWNLSYLTSLVRVVYREYSGMPTLLYQIV